MSAIKRLGVCYHPSLEGARELAERERLEQIHDEKMKHTLLMTDGKNTKFLQQCLLQAWQQYTYEVRH